MLNEPIVVVDVETTGLHAGHGHRVTEVAALRVVGDEITDRFVTLVDCGVAIPPEIEALTGITDDMLRGAPRAQDVMQRLARFVGTSVVAAHNASFDLKFLRQECELIGTQLASSGTLCTIRLARRLAPRLTSYSLSNVARHFGVSYRGQAHRAEADAEVAAHVLIRLSELAGGTDARPMSARTLSQIMSWRIADAQSRLRQIKSRQGRARGADRARRAMGCRMADARVSRRWNVAGGQVWEQRATRVFPLDGCTVTASPEAGIRLPLLSREFVPWSDIELDGVPVTSRADFIARIGGCFPPKYARVRR